MICVEVGMARMLAEINHGTLYPLLSRMERHGWLKSEVPTDGGPRARKDYRLTSEGRKVLAMIREQLKELYREVVSETDDKKS
jgi:PadR family transcriptional regulator PadR